MTNRKKHKLPDTITTGLRKHGLVYLKSRKCILLFGGKYKSITFNTIYKISILDEKWSELRIKMAENMSSFGIVKTRQERFIIILGGANGLKRFNDIYVYDTRMNAWSKSNIQTPVKSTFRATISNNNPVQDEKLCFGFIRNCYGQDGFKDFQQLPYYLMKYVSQWISNEDIYLIQTSKQKDGADMWSINVDDILQNTV